MLAGQVRILRSQLGNDIDRREAFVSRVLLNIYGGPGMTNVWTDDLEVFGHVPSVTRRRRPRVRRPSARTPAPLRAVSPAGLSPERGQTASPIRLQCGCRRSRTRGPDTSAHPAARRQAGRLGLEGQRLPDLPPLRSNIAAKAWPSSSSWASTPSGCDRRRRRPFFPKPGNLACGWSVRRRICRTPERDARYPARRPRSGRSSSPCSSGTWGTD